MNIKTFFSVPITFGLLLTLGCKSNKDQPFRSFQTRQIEIERIEMMPDIPESIKILDWKKKALDYDKYVFDFNREDGPGPLIWLDHNQRNIAQTTFGLYTAIHDVRQGPEKNNGEFHESLNSLAAILGAGLVGIDKTNQDGYNYVKMVQNYFNSDTGWNIMMNNTCPEVALLGGGYGRDWWYDVLPNVLYYAVCDIFPNVDNADFIQLKIADQFYKADSVLNGNYNYSFFDYGKMKGMVNQIPYQQDAAGGHGYVLYSAYQKFKDKRYLEGAKSSIAVLDAQTESRFYEILLPLGIYTASRLNAEHGTNFDIKKMINWTFDGCKALPGKGRSGWGVVAGKWGVYEVNGLQGNTKEGKGYVFLMNSMEMAWPLVPMVKYQPQFARAIGKWMLNNVNAARLFYPQEIDDTHQWLPEMKDITNNNVAYEGLRYKDIYKKPSLVDVIPVALGDGPNWTRKLPEQNPPESMFSLYSTSPVGILGAIVRTTNVKGILQLNCNSTDFYASKPFPVYLYYNPYPEDKLVTYHTEKPVDLFDIVSKDYIGENISGKAEILIPADMARIVYEIPVGAKIYHNDKDQLMIGENVIAY